MASQLSEDQRIAIRILQYLSMLYVPGDPDRSRVSSRQTAQALGLNSYDIEDIYEKLARYRFVATESNGPAGLPPIMDARLDPSNWDRNRSPLSALYAHYVANAPPSLRSVQSQRAMVPTRGCPLVPNGVPAACNTVIASDFNGVYNPYQVQTFCCPVQQLPPVETCLLISNTVESDKLTSENLVALTIFRLLLRGLYSFGVGGLSLAEWLDRGPASGTPPLYCLAETDDALAVAPAPIFNRNVASGGPMQGPYSGAPYVLTASDGSATYTVTPTPSGAGTIERGGTSVPFTVLGSAANGTWVLQLAGRLP
jgi:hypothetical protein